MESTQDPAKLLSTPIFSKNPTNYQPNLFTESRQEFTELEKKIVALVINQIGNMSLKGDIKPGVNIKFQIPYSELTKQRYDQISAAAESLQSKRLMYRNSEDESFDFITPFPRVRSQMADGKKVIEITMFAEVVPHFAELGQRYTKYDIDIMLSLSSVYAQRMFEIVSMFYNRGQRQFTYTVDRLRMLLNCPDTYRYVEFKINALEVAQRELMQKANIVLDWEPSKKEGKRILELLFTIKTDRQLAAEGVEQDRQALRGLSMEEAIRLAWPLLAKYKLVAWQKDLIISDFNLLDTFYRIHSELTNGLRPGVKNPTAYLIKSLGIDQVKKHKLKAVSDTPLFPDSISRSGSLQSIGSIFENMANKG
ncbi:replication initiation protein [Larkinella sp. C7]|uniref:replication initiation protein n=1 Tax=Larkinella sp. C7 TaxID=2576607 RepID=UPI0011112127|nr:replication initiation protein [Larkinella sp. C7]